MKLKFSGKYVLVLGGSCETALCLAKLLIESQLSPILSYRTHEGRMRINSFLSPDFSDQYETIHLDFSRQDTITTLENTTWQNLDYVVDFIQGNYESLIPGACHQSIVDYITSNLTNRAVLLQKISRAMLARRKGRLVYISSTAASKQNPGQGFYAATKQASETIYRNIGIEMGDRGVTTVSLRLGYIDAGRGKNFLETQPKMKRYGLSPIQVAESIMFFLSDSAIGFNATELILDKGLVASKGYV
jgi:3-oxoacyl-[acyl-carrier protein] reductase